MSGYALPIGLAASLLIVGVVASPAGAVETRSGYKSCAGVGANEVVTRGEGRGDQVHEQRGASRCFDVTTSQRVVRTWNNNYITAQWEVRINNEMYGAGTYAYCPG